MSASPKTVKVAYRRREKYIHSAFPTTLIDRAAALEYHAENVWAGWPKRYCSDWGRGIVLAMFVKRERFYRADNRKTQWI